MSDFGRRPWRAYLHGVKRSGAFNRMTEQAGRSCGLVLAVPILVGLVMTGIGLVSQSRGAARPKTELAMIVGANACAECHKDSAKIWKATHHFTTFQNMPRSKEARAIARNMKIRRIKSAPLCLSCHFTQRQVRGRVEVTSGISCEACHGAGRNWLDVHSGFSGKARKELESKAEAAARWKKSEANGMIRPGNLYATAKRCYACHVVPKEQLVNVGGHPPGSTFELVAWSQGEVRHNIWYSKGRSNPTAGINRQRMMYLAGIAVEIEVSLRAVGVATQKKSYAIRMAHRADAARNKMAAAARALPRVPELRKIVELSHSAGLKLNNRPALFAAADGVAAQARTLLSKYDGSQFAKLDAFLPKKGAFKGQPAK